MENKHIECNNCGNVVQLLNGLTNTCDTCETDYNGAGEELAPRSDWGWETGESITGIHNDYHYDDY